MPRSSLPCDHDDQTATTVVNLKHTLGTILNSDHSHARRIIFQSVNADHT